MVQDVSDAPAPGERTGPSCVVTYVVCSYPAPTRALLGAVHPTPAPRVSMVMSVGVTDCVGNLDQNISFIASDAGLGLMLVVS